MSKKQTSWIKKSEQQPTKNQLCSIKIAGTSCFENGLEAKTTIINNALYFGNGYWFKNGQTYASSVFEWKPVLQLTTNNKHIEIKYRDIKRDISPFVAYALNTKTKETFLLSSYSSKEKREKLAPLFLQKLIDRPSTQFHLFITK